MGRRKDDPAVQAAKGFPGRRKGKVLREIEAAAAQVQHEPSADPYALPALFRKAPAYYRRASEVWAEQITALRTKGRRGTDYRPALTRYCLWVQYFEAAAEEVRKGGMTVRWTPAGSDSERVIPNPAYRVMEQARLALQPLEAEFGFAPLSDASLVRVESFNRRQLSLPIEPPGRGHGAPGQGDDDDPMDLMMSADSPPPGRIN